MPLVYFDSSAFMKLLVEEAGSELAADLWDGCEAALSSRLAYPEVRAALAAARRHHDLGDDDLRTAERAWQVGMVNRVVRSTSVPIAELPRPRMRSPSQ